MQELNTAKLRNDFPILSESVRNKLLIYLDNAATTQKPKSVLKAIEDYYVHDNANVHRGLHTLATRADIAYLKAREKVQYFINAKYSEEIIFVRGTTEAINLVAQSFGKTHCKDGDAILISIMEHHSNIVPWQILNEQIKIKLLVTRVDDQGEIDLEDYANLLSKRPKLVAITHVSNVLGTINPVRQMVKMAHELEIPVLLDGAQAVGHFPVDVKDLDCDFYVFSGHKMYAPTGIGVLYGKKFFLERMSPYQGGGGMIQTVDFAETKYAELPNKFEAGTPNIEGAVGLAAAIDYLKAVNLTLIEKQERMLTQKALASLQEIVGLKIIGNAQNRVGVISFVLDKVHPHDISTILDMNGIAIRAGHHCAMPLMNRFQVPATARISLGLYNTVDEINSTISSIDDIKRIFANG